MEEGGEVSDSVIQPSVTTQSRKNKKQNSKKRLKEGKNDDVVVESKKQKKQKTGRRNNNANNNNAASSSSLHPNQGEALSPAQQAVQDQMRRALEEDQYSAAGSIVDTESDEEDNFMYRGQAVRLDKAFMQQTVRKLNALERNTAAANILHQGDDDCEDADDPEGVGNGSNKRGIGKIKKKKKRNNEVTQLLLGDSGVGGGGRNNSTTTGIAGANATNGGGTGGATVTTSVATTKDPFALEGDDDIDRDGGSIFGATTGASNSTWVECDKCKKWRRLRGVVDEKKLPSKWFCSMNKNDPERARCSAPEEEYEAPHTAESAADARIRKHLRVWVRRLQCNEAYEARLPTITRGKSKRSSSSNNSGSNGGTAARDPYEWIKCCNPSCGKWRPILRVMDAKTIIDRTINGEWFCVMNTWDEKAASCASPQETLPAIGCPPWVVQDEPSPQGPVAPPVVATAPPTTKVQ